MSYDSILLDAAYRQIERHEWLLERLHSKARATVAAGTAALSITTVGLSGFATLLAGAGLDHAALLESLFGGMVRGMIAVAIMGIVAIIASMGVSVFALKSCKLRQILTSASLECVTVGESSGGQGTPHGESEDDLRQMLLRKSRRSIKTLEACNRRVSSRVLWGQALLVIGIALVSMIPLVALGRMLLW